MRRTMHARNYEEAKKMLYGLISPSMQVAAWRRDNLKGGIAQEDVLGDFRHHCTSLGIDVDALRVIHIAGTKGKGSTAAFTENLLRCAAAEKGVALKTGLYTSPHLVSPRERIRLNGQCIAKELFAKYFWSTYDVLHSAYTTIPPYFKFLTLMALRVFQEESVDVAVVEVGVGGRTDYTNVVSPCAAGISRLDYDHTAVLGSTMREIALHKAGILKKGRIGFTVKQEPEGASAIAEYAAQVGCELSEVPSLEEFSGGGNVELAGPDCQKENAALALCLARTFLKNTTWGAGLCRSSEGEPADAVARECNGSNGLVANGHVVEPLGPLVVEDWEARGLQGTRWPGRWQKLEVGGSNPKREKPLSVFLDGAHTIASMKFCGEWYGRTRDCSATSSVLVFGCSHGRDALRLLQHFASDETARSFDTVLVSLLRPSPVVSADELTSAEREELDTLQAAARRVFENSSVVTSFSIPQACTLALSGEHDQVLACGSLYLVGGFLSALRETCGVDVEGLADCE